MQVTVTNAYTASINNATEVAHVVEWSDGTTVRAVVGAGMIRKEYKQGQEWKQSGKPYTVRHDRKRQGERIVERCKAFLAA